VAYLNSPFGKGQADFYAIGNAQLTVTLGDLGKFKIPLPSMQEQEKFVNELLSIDKVINGLVAKLGAIKNTKKALMQDLLTGTVRVKVS